MIESFSQISPTVKVQEMATVQDIQQYGYEYDLGFDEPINRTGSLELPQYDSKKNYFE